MIFTCNFKLTKKQALLFDLYRKRTNFFVFIRVLLRYITAPLEEVERHVPKVGRILDLGCGDGLFSHLMYLSSKKRQIIGIDIDKCRINTANRINLNNESLIFTTRSINTFVKNEFDTVVLIDVLYLIPFEEQENLLKTIHNILKEGGILIIKTMNPELKLKFLWNFIQEFVSVRIIKTTKAKEKKFYFIKDINHFKNILQKRGFFVETLRIDKNFLHPHILLLCHKQSFER